MPGLLKIADLRDREYLAFDIADLLPLVSEEGSRLAWCVFPVGECTELTGDFSALGMSAEEFAEEVDCADAGVPLSWGKLQDLAKMVRQTIWGSYIGCPQQEAFPRLPSLFLDNRLHIDRAEDEWYAAVEIAFQAIDSSFWLAYARDDAVLERLRSAFREVTVLRRWE